MNKYGWLDGYLRSFPGAEMRYKEEWQWYRYLVDEKQFAALCDPEPKYGVYGGRELINLKCDPEFSKLLRAEYPDILPGFYSDKKTWISVFLDGNVPDALLRDLCRQSYEAVFAKLTKKRQREIAAGS